MSKLKRDSGSLIGSIVIAFLVTLVPILGLYAGLIPSRGLDGSIDSNPVKFYLVVALWFFLSVICIFLAASRVHDLFLKYGGNYNWGTFKAILRDAKK